MQIASSIQYRRRNYLEDKKQVMAVSAKCPRGIQWTCYIGIRRLQLAPPLRNFYRLWPAGLVRLLLLAASKTANEC